MSIALASQEQVGRSSAGKTTGEPVSVGGDLVAEKVETEAKVINEEAALFPVTIPTIIFQCVMVLTCLYYGMLFSNWGDAVIAGSNDTFY